MAKLGLRSVFHFIAFFCLFFMVQESKARQFTVGSSEGWSGYSQWAGINRFQIGDSILFKYNTQSDTLLQVTKENYDQCETGSFIRSFQDGQTVFTFDHSGPFYFISGNKENCKKNEKLAIVVLADRTKSAAVPSASPPPPSPSPPPPAAPNAPSPTVITTPTPASSPPAVEHKHNAASSLISSSASYMVALFFASSIVLVL